MRVLAHELDRPLDAAEAALRAAEREPREPAQRGSLIYSRGPCARENLLAVRAMPKPLPDIWRESADASTIVAMRCTRALLSSDA